MTQTQDARTNETDEWIAEEYTRDEAMRIAKRWSDPTNVTDSLLWLLAVVTTGMFIGWCLT